MRNLLIAGLLCLAAAGAAAQDLGKKAFEQCAACHSLKAGENGVGPTLHGLLGSTAGTVEGFRFSGPMKRSGIVWDEKTLTEFLRNPQAVVPNTRMPFSGMTDEAELKALVAYLATATR
ncbi:cytochrome c [Duganella sp. 1224]|uniref:c-type cytochrome n=1 Tax=Duganella sp. 1224 TaxID=2587052 RepID=UPI0015C6DA25|nr:c-type cytochrome [Duganella sp. 1224]NYE62792.1 cytochrome c [Duganella sp. 1224]